MMIQGLLLWIIKATPRPQKKTVLRLIQKHVDQHGYEHWDTHILGTSIETS